MGLESSFQSTAIAYLNGIPGCRAENVSGNASQSGRPDLNACYKGRMIKLELKSPDHGNEASKKQALELRRWNRAGAVTGVVYDMESIRELIDALNRGDQNYLFSRVDRGCESWFTIPKV